MTLSFSTIAIFFSRPFTLTINSLDIDFLSEERTHTACGAQASVPALSCDLFVDGSCRQNVPAADLRYRTAIAAGDAFDLDQADRDLSRDLEVPSALADGHYLDSNGNSIDARGYRLIAPGSGASVD